MNLVLEFILSEIKKINDGRESDQLISSDDTNQELVNIFHDAANKFSNIEFELVDDEDVLTELFSYEGYCRIREAESGSY